MSTKTERERTSQEWFAAEINSNSSISRRDSSVGRASDWRSEGPWFKSGGFAWALNNPGSRQHGLLFFHSIPLKEGCQIQGKSGIERIICVGECLGPFKAVNAQTSAFKVFSKSQGLETITINDLQSGKARKQTVKYTFNPQVYMRGFEWVYFSICAALLN